MHSKWGYKICICSVILGKLESFWDYKGSSSIFPKILDVHLRMYNSNGFLELHSFNFSANQNWVMFCVYIFKCITKVRIFDSSFHHIF